jgi:hypothetical protein
MNDRFREVYASRRVIFQSFCCTFRTLYRGDAETITLKGKAFALTIIAAIQPPDGAPFFLADTLISKPGNNSDVKVLGPGGLTKQARGHLYQPSRLERKCVIINAMTFAAYAGTSFVAKTALYKVAHALADRPPDAQTISKALTEDEDKLTQHDTSLLVAFVDKTGVHQLTFGPHFIEHTCADGTKVTASGSGCAPLIRTLENVLGGRTVVNFPTSKNASFWQKGRARLWRLFHPRLDSHHRVVVQLANVVAEFCAGEAIRGEFDSHFGGLVEIATCAGSGFFMLPSLMIAIELFTRDGDALRPASSSYLTYRYYEDILLYRRFGETRQEELKATFGTDYIASTVKPLLRKPTNDEKRRAIDELLAAPFHETTLQVFNWSDVNDLTQRRTSVRAPDEARFWIDRREDRFRIYHSNDFSAEIAKRFGASRIDYS